MPNLPMLRCVNDMFCYCSQDEHIALINKWKDEHPTDINIPPTAAPCSIDKSVCEFKRTNSQDTPPAEVAAKLGDSYRHTIIYGDQTSGVLDKRKKKKGTKKAQSVQFGMTELLDITEVKDEE